MARFTVIVTLCSLLVACSPLPESWTIEGDPPARVAEALQIARDQAPCDVDPWGGIIEFVPEPFVCGKGVPLVNGEPTKALGCFTGDDDDGLHVVVVATAGQDAEDTALMHELGHATWGRCGRSEHVFHQPAFLRWVDAGNERLHAMREKQTANPCR